MSDQQKYPLNSLGFQIRDHWLKYRPQMSAELKARGLLDKSVYQAQELTSDALAELVSDQGMRHQEAWEAVRQEWAFLPAEKDEPENPEFLEPSLAPQS